jgi:multiple sugar transport system substrate-binding protein
MSIFHNAPNRDGSATGGSNDFRGVNAAKYRRKSREQYPGLNIKRDICYPPSETANNRNRRLKPPFFRVMAVAISLSCLTGCSGSKSNSSSPAEKLPFSGRKLKLAVAGDAELAAAIVRLQGEWNTQTGAEVEVLQFAEKNLVESLSAENIPGDAVVCDPYFMGLLAEKELAVGVSAAAQNTRQWADIFDLIRQQEVGWGGKATAVPFGSPVFVIYYRADLFEQLHRKPPKTWAEYQELAKLMAGMKQSSVEHPWSGAAEPLGPGWAGLVLLARAAPYVKHRDNYSTLFNIKTMAPLVAGPPLVRALEELAAAAKFGPAEALQSDPAAVRAAFWQGKCGMAITWPSAADEKPGEKAAAIGQSQIPVGFFELPGSNKVYNVNNKTWETRAEDENPRVPFLGVAGRVGLVLKQSTQQEAALELLLWLSGEQNSPQISPSSSATTLFRRSHLKQPLPWVEKAVPPAAAAKYAELTANTLHGEQWLAFNLPGREEYLAALDEAVQSAVRGDASPADALKKAEKTWREITEKRGVDSQRSAYLHSLGLQ